jgi:1,4-dihydroxy-2-naphthoate octaprenyltransferase
MIAIILAAAIACIIVALHIRDYQNDKAWRKR